MSWTDNLTILSEFKKVKPNGKFRTWCVCECKLCGGTTEVCKTELNKRTSVGCRNCVKTNKSGPEGSAWLFHYTRYKTSAKARGKTFDLSTQDFKSICSQNCNYCGDPPRLNTACKDHNTHREAQRKYPKLDFYDKAIIYAHGIDRVDSSVGYTVENSVSCCSMCNYMKLDHTKEDFLSHAKKIAAHNEQSK